MLTPSDSTSRTSLVIPAEACVSMPRWLSCSEFKRQLYGTDTHAIEGLEAVVAIAGEKAQSFCSQHSLLIVKPETLVSRKLEKVFLWLVEVGFSIVEVVPFRFTPAITRNLWGYHWNAVTQAHRRTVDLLVGSGPSVAILVRSLESSTLPASLRLAELKGHANLERRQPGQLRHELGNYNALLNHVHSPDEPIDVVRELAVVLGPDLEDIWGRAQKEQTLDVSRLDDELIPSLYRAAGAPQCLDLSGVLREIEAALDADIHDVAIGDVICRCEAGDLDLSRWQQIVLATAHTESMRTDVRRLVPSVSAADWLGHEIEH